MNIYSISNDEIWSRVSWLILDIRTNGRILRGPLLIFQSVLINAVFTCKFKHLKSFRPIICFICCFFNEMVSIISNVLPRKDEMLFWLVGWTYETVLISLIKPIWHTDCTPNCCNSDIFLAK